MKYDLDFFRGNAWDPFRDFAALQKRMNRLFEESGMPTSVFKTDDKKWVPACDIDEDESRYLVTVDLPGVPKDNVKVEFHDGALVISGDKYSERKEDKGTRHLEERTSGMFRRWFMLPGEIDASKIQASYENGVLRVTAPKTAAEKPKQIPINEGPPGAPNGRDERLQKSGASGATRVA